MKSRSANAVRSALPGAVAAALLAGGPLKAQEWLPVNDSQTREIGLSQREATEFRAVKDRIAEVFRVTSSLGGGSDLHAVRPARVLAPRIGAAGPARGSQQLWLYQTPSKFSARILVHVNSTGGLLQSAQSIEDEVGTLYVLPPRLEDAGGWPVYVDLSTQPRRLQCIRSHTLITRPGVPVWKPVNQERWIRAMLRQEDAKLEEEIAKLRTQVARHPEQRQRQEEMFRRESDPNRAREFRERMEDLRSAQRTALAAAERGDWDALANTADRPLAFTGRGIAALRAELANLAPAQRSAPAYCCSNAVPIVDHGAPRAQGLLEAEHPRSSPVVAINQEYLRADLPAWAPQFLVVERLQGLNSREGDFFTTLLDDVWQQLDWRALGRMVAGGTGR